MLKPKINESIKKQIAKRKKKGNLLYYSEIKQKSFKPWTIFLQKANKEQSFQEFLSILI